MNITPQELLDNKPSNEEVDRVDQMWAMFDTTTQFLAALKQVLINREVGNEIATLEQFLPRFAEVEAHDMNIPVNQPIPPITQRAVPK